MKHKARDIYLVIISGLIFLRALMNIMFPGFSVAESTRDYFAQQSQTVAAMGKSLLQESLRETLHTTFRDAE